MSVIVYLGCILLYGACVEMSGEDGGQPSLPPLQSPTISSSIPAKIPSNYPTLEYTTHDLLRQIESTRLCDVIITCD